MGNSSSFPTENPTTTNYESYYSSGSPPDSPKTRAARKAIESSSSPDWWTSYGGFPEEPSNSLFGFSWKGGHAKKLQPAEVERGKLPNIDSKTLRNAPEQSPYSVVCSSDRHVESFDTFHAGDPGLTPGHTGVILKDGNQTKLLESVPGDLQNGSYIGNGKVKESNWGRRSGWIAGPTEPVKEELWKGKAKEEKEQEAMAHFKKNYEGKPYNHGLVNEGKGDSYHCGEFSREFLNSQLSDEARRYGADVAAPRNLPFDEGHQQKYYRQNNSGNPPPKDKTGVSPGDNLARGNYEIKGYVDASKLKCTPDRPCPPWRRRR